MTLASTNLVRPRHCVTLLWSSVMPSCLPFFWKAALNESLVLPGTTHHQALTAPKSTSHLQTHHNLLEHPTHCPNFRPVLELSWSSPPCSLLPFKASKPPPFQDTCPDPQGEADTGPSLPPSLLLSPLLPDGTRLRPCPRLPPLTPLRTPLLGPCCLPSSLLPSQALP